MGRSAAISVPSNTKDATAVAVPLAGSAAMPTSPPMNHGRPAWVFRSCLVLRACSSCWSQWSVRSWCSCATSGRGLSSGSWAAGSLPAACLCWVGPCTARGQRKSPSRPTGPFIRTRTKASVPAIGITLPVHSRLQHRSVSRGGHNSVVHAIGPVGRTEPGVATQVIGLALHLGRDAASG